LVGLVIPYLLIGVMSSGTVISEITVGALPSVFGEGGVPKHLGSFVICVVVLLYVFFGGMRGTAWANAFQTCVFMILGVVTFFVIANQIGGKESLWANLKSASEAVDSAKFSRSHIPHLYFASYMLIPLSVGMFPHIFQHWLTAKSARSFKLPVVAHPIMILIVWAPCVLVGVWATTQLPAETPSNAVLAMLVKKLAGETLAGLLTAGILAAIMSSLDSQFMCLGTMFTTDLLQHYGGKKKFSEKQLVTAARGFIVAIVTVTYLLSLLEARAVFSLGIWCFSGFTALVPLVVAALYWRRLTLAGAMSSILATALLWSYFFYQADFGGNPGYKVFGMLPVATLIVVSSITLVLVSLVTRPPSKATIERFFPEVG
jgi:solute:Na+ symporter, SSS family